jgi:hypothetical protein
MQCGMFIVDGSLIFCEHKRKDKMKEREKACKRKQRGNVGMCCLLHEAR